MKEEHMTIMLKSPHGAAPSAPPVHTPRKARRWRRLVRPLLALAVIALVFFACYWVYAKITGSPAAATNDPQQVVEQVGKLMLLPSDETPTIAVVSDLSKLEGQKFFANARQGDVVLMYPKSARAILFDPQMNKIIEVAPITSAQQ